MTIQLLLFGCAIQEPWRALTYYPDWAERNERILEEMRWLLRDGFYEKEQMNKPDYVM